ncbi:Oxoglutarate/iron-dependent dioxygenase [Corchorus capsularis]|uniref:Oxoglutarate/iron-dependent dioxygenase n=1 Tax=Corchorus capsularis TaxID=210143 RepID=A0A1R3I7B4_COCAP|nr:Oxoglutarate/iron-dependent dioxygenase [Corchorus capsularis]
MEKLLDVPTCKAVPVIDLGKGLGDGNNRTDLVNQLLKASQEFGMFQVVNHGIPEELLNDTRSVCEEFCELPAEDKASLLSDDPECKLVTGITKYETDRIHFWRDYLRHPCHPSEECMKSWPQKPTRYREVVAAYSIEAKKLGLRILELLCQGLGIDTNYFQGKLSEYVQMVVNYYPPCPDPSLTIPGLPKHSDIGILTILFQGDVCGLQLFKDGEWLNADPLPNALVVNIAYLFQVISNKKLKSAEHRAVTNSSRARMSVCFFIYPSDDGIVEPAAADEINPPLFRAFQFNEFMRNFYSMGRNLELAIQPFKLET